MSVLFTAIFSGIEIIWDRQFGFLKETLVAPVSRFEIMIGRTVGGATVASLQGLIVFAITFVIGFRPVSGIFILPAFGFIFLIALLFTALGMTIASKLEDMQAFPLIMNFLVMPLFFLSGSLFPIKGLPGPISFIAKINPLAYGVDGLRGTLIGVSQFGLFNDLSVLVIITVVLVAIGGYLFSKIEI